MHSEINQWIRLSYVCGFGDDSGLKWLHKSNITEHQRAHYITQYIYIKIVTCHKLVTALSIYGKENIKRKNKMAC